MTSRTLAFTSLFTFALAVCTGLIACGEDGIQCDVTWWSGAPDTSELVGETSYNYNFGSVQKAVDACGDDQATDPDRPGNANGHSCDCETK